jgi:ribonuclease D
MTALLKDGSLENYIVDVLSEHVSFSAVSAFNEVLANRSIYKIFHGAEQDIQWLARDFGVHVVNMFDTGVAARILGLGQKSLKAVIETYFPRVVIDKTHQLSDWRARPLPQAMLHYAVSDTKYLVHIWRAMVQDLLTQGGGTSASSTAYGRGQLRQVVRESAQLCKRSFNGVYDAEIAADKIVLRNGTQKNHRLLVNLLIWRDKLARFMNINCGLVFKERELLRFASLRTLRGVHDIVRGSFGGLTGDVVHAEELWEIWTAAQVQISGNEQEKEETGERPQPEEEKRTLRLEREEVAVVEKSVRTSGKPSKLIDSFM